MLNLINHDPDIDKIYFYAEDPHEAKYQLLINKRESTGLSYLMIQKLLLDTQMIWVLIIKILKNTIQTKNKKYYLFLMI